MTATIQLAGHECRFDPNRPIDISIPLNFNGPQPNAYGVELASSKACEAGDFIGDTRQGGSVNFEQYTFIPHCNGTHTECVGHITTKRISVRDCLRDVFMRAVLVSVEPAMTGDGDFVITRPTLQAAFASGTLAVQSGDVAVIVRTLPNDDGKLTRLYDESNVPPYFSAEATEFIVSAGFKHLLVDLPSIDRIYDDGKLVNHRLFWNVEPGSFQTNTTSRMYATVTELIYVPNTVKDGEYLLNLQIAPFEADASPSRPVIFLSEPPA